MQMRNLFTLLAASGAAAQSTGLPPMMMPGNGTITTTIVVPSFVTYCPKPTVITWKDQCYTAKKPGPITITNCPCTITTVSLRCAPIPGLHTHTHTRIHIQTTISGIYIFTEKTHTD